MSCVTVGADPLAVDSEPPQKVSHLMTRAGYVCMHSCMIKNQTRGNQLSSADLMMREFSKQFCISNNIHFILTMS